MILSPRDAWLFAIATQSPEVAFSSIPLQEALLPPTLRSYQADMLLQALAYMQQGYRRILIQAPTGAGKTVLAGALMGAALDLGMRSQFIVHRKELINQTSASFDRSGLPHGFVAAKRPFDPLAMVQLAGVQTLVNRLAALLPPNLAIVDECHHATAGTWARVLASYPDAYIIGLTATPQRLDGRGLDDQFDVIVRGPSVAWLIEHGYLSPYEYYAPSIPDMTGVKTLAGDFNRAGSAEVMDKPKLIGDTVEHYLSLAPGEQGIVFATSREHSRRIADAFIGSGVPAMHVDGEMEDSERDRFDDAFRAGDLRIGVNVGLFGEGYDVPNISYVGIAAPTKSLVNHLQWCGRALRPADGKLRAVISDHAGNALRGLGLPDDEREWTLVGRPKKGTNNAGQDADPITQCLTCFRIYYSAQRSCPGCGVEAPPAPREVKQVAGTLSRLEREDLKRRQAETRKAEERACESFDEFVSLAKARNYQWPDQWARRQCKFRRIPITSDGDWYREFDGPSDYDDANEETSERVSDYD